MYAFSNYTYRLAENTRTARTKSNPLANVSRSRRFAVRLQLPVESVAPVVQSLLQLLCEQSASLGALTQVLVLKVCAKLAVHACRHPLTFKQMIDNAAMTRKLLVTGKSILNIS